MLVFPSIDVENAHSPLVHWPGASTGQGTPTDRPDRIAGRVAVPLQVAGGMERPDSIRLAFAASATHVVVSMAMADHPETLRECPAVAGIWLAVGLDSRPVSTFSDPVSSTAQ